jgi:hypothetical protein
MRTWAQPRPRRGYSTGAQSVGDGRTVRAWEVLATHSRGTRHAPYVSFGGLIKRASRLSTLST